MLKTILALAVFFSFPALASALTPETDAFLQSLGYAQNSPEVTRVAADSVNGRTLDSLAAKHDEDGVRRFITTRNFIHRYMKDPSTPFPTHYYDVAYLSASEQDFIFNQIAAGFGARIG